MRWMYPNVSKVKIDFHNPFSDTREERDGFRIGGVWCGVAIYPKGIQVTRLAVGRVCRVKSFELPDTAKITDAWHERNRYNFCSLSDQFMFLHVMSRVDTNDMYKVTAGGDGFSKTRTGQIFYERNRLAKPNSDRTNPSKVYKLFTAAFNPKVGIFQKSLKNQLPLKRINFTLPNVQENGVKIDRYGISVSPAKSVKISDYTDMDYDVVIDEPFCFALTVGNSVLSKEICLLPKKN